MRIATWNVNSLNARQARVEQWLEEFAPDVLCMQETKLADDDFPEAAFRALGYESVHHGEGRWNGVAILSNVGLADAHRGFGDGGPPDRDARIVWATCGGIRIASCYVPNGRSLDDEHYQYKLEWLDRLVADLRANTSPEADVAVLGDFNIAPQDRDVWDPKVLEGATHGSPAEREKLASIEAWGATDVFRTFYDEAGLYTWWDYRGGNFHKRMGMRIDLIYLTQSLVRRTTHVLIDRNARKGESPSDHTPVFVDLVEE